MVEQRALDAVDSLAGDKRFFLFVGLDRHDPRVMSLIDRLGERGLTQNALVVFTACRGWREGDLGSAGVEVPLMVKRPKDWLMGREAGVFETRKLFYLILGEAGARVTEPDYPWSAVAEWYGQGESGLQGGRELRAVYFDGLRLIGGPGTPYRLFPIGDDREISGERPAEIDRGKELLNVFLESVPPARPPASGPSAPPRR
jgi:hypothetical protein